MSTIFYTAFNFHRRMQYVYVDDIVILSGGYWEMEGLLKAVNRRAAAVGIRISFSKTKLMPAFINQFLMSSAKPSSLIMSPWRTLKISSALARCSPQTAWTAKRSEAGLIVPLPHSLTCDPGCSGKYLCVQPESTRQWFARFCSTDARRGQYE